MSDILTLAESIDQTRLKLPPEKAYEDKASRSNSANKTSWLRGGFRRRTAMAAKSSKSSRGSA